MEKNKKTEVITFRTTTSTKEKIETIALLKEWSIAYLCEKIIAEWVEDVDI